MARREAGTDRLARLSPTESLQNQKLLQSICTGTADIFFCRPRREGRGLQTLARFRISGGGGGHFSGEFLDESSASPIIHPCSHPHRRWGVPCARGWSPGAGRAGAAPCPVWILCRWASQTTRARMVGGAASPQPVGCTHTCSCTEPCSCSCVRHRCSGRARQDGVKSWPLCANRKPGCRAIAARSVTTRQRGVHTLLHSAQPSESLAPCHTLA